MRVDKLPWREIDGRTVIIQPSQGQVHELNPVASLLWSHADGKQSLDKLASLVAERFDVDYSHARADAAELFEELSRLGLMQLGPLARTAPHGNP